MEINCTQYEQKDIIRIMRDSTDKSQTEFAKDINKNRGWVAKAERNEINIKLKDFLELAKINNIEIIIKKD